MLVPKTPILTQHGWGDAGAHAEEGGERHGNGGVVVHAH